jgi:hypothetical protein
MSRQAHTDATSHLRGDASRPERESARQLLSLDPPVLSGGEQRMTS